MTRRVFQIILALAAFACAAGGLAFLNAYRKGIVVHLGDSGPPVLSPPASGKRLPPSGTALPGAPPAGTTNEYLYARLQKETAEIGIQGIIPRGEDRSSPAEGFLGPRLAYPETREQAEAAVRELTSMQRAVDAGKKPVVPLEGTLAPLLAKKDNTGGPLELEKEAPSQTPSQDTPHLIFDPSQSSWSGAYGGGQEGTFMISDPQSWQKTWAAVSSDPLPAVDFARQQVAAVFLGYRPTGGYRIEIFPPQSVASTQFLVSYRELPPLDAPAQMGATSPFALRVTARSSLPTRFERLP